MNDTDPTKGETVSCDMCSAEILRSDSWSPEGREYALFFCGVDCYEKWIREQLQQEE